MLISAWVTLLLAIPVLLLGEWLVRHVRLLGRFNIPAPVVGGLLVAFLMLIGHISSAFPARFETNVSARLWTWLVTTEPEWLTRPAKSVSQPFLVMFFTCIGLNASWQIARRAGVQVVIFLAICLALALVQNLLGVGLSRLLGVSPLLGLACGSVSMIGGHGTALGFAPELENAGLQGASVLGAAAATYGIIAGALLGGPLGGALIRRDKLKPARTSAHLPGASTGAARFLMELRALRSFGPDLWRHLLLVLACVKAGAWVSYFAQNTGLTFPVYMGALTLGVVVRNLLDLRATWVRTEVIDTIGAVSLSLFLSMAMMNLHLADLAKAAGPMLVILVAQSMVIFLFAWLVTYRLMGRDYDAAIMAGGQVGFGLGATANAIATMKSLVESFGPAPRAFLVVPIVGSFLVDFFNAVNITVFLNLLSRQ